MRREDESRSRGSCASAGKTPRAAAYGAIIVLRAPRANRPHDAARVGTHGRTRHRDLRSGADASVDVVWEQLPFFLRRGRKTFFCAVPIRL